MTPQYFVDTSYLPFLTRKRKQAMDEQFAHFIEMIEKLHVSVPLMDVLHVPSYTKYIKDIINNKRPLPSIEVVKMTEECSDVYLKRRRTLGALPSHVQLAPSSLILPCAILGQAWALCPRSSSPSWTSPTLHLRQWYSSWPSPWSAIRLGLLKIF